VIQGAPSGGVPISPRHSNPCSALVRARPSAGLAQPARAGVRNPSQTAALVGAAHSQAGAAMRTSAQRHRSGSRLRAAALCFGAVALLYGGSFYTRDWRSVVAHAGQPAGEPLPARATVALHAAETKPTAAPVRVEPEVTGALPRDAEPVTTSRAAKTVTRPAASPHSQSQPSRSRVPHASAQPTPGAAAPAVRAPSPRDGSNGPAATPVQFQLAERGN